MLSNQDFAELLQWPEIGNAELLSDESGTCFRAELIDRLELLLSGYREASPVSREKLKQTQLPDGTLCSEHPWYSFVLDISAMLNLDELQTFELWQSFIARVLLGGGRSAGPLGHSLAAEDYSPHLLTRVRSFYYAERLALLQSLQEIFRASLDSSHPFHAAATICKERLLNSGFLEHVLKDLDLIYTSRWNRRGAEEKTGKRCGKPPASFISFQVPSTVMEGDDYDITSRGELEKFWGKQQFVSVDDARIGSAVYNKAGIRGKVSDLRDEAFRVVWEDGKDIWYNRLGVGSSATDETSDVDVKPTLIYTLPSIVVRIPRLGEAELEHHVTKKEAAAILSGTAKKAIAGEKKIEVPRLTVFRQKVVNGQITVFQALRREEIYFEHSREPWARQKVEEHIALLELLFMIFYGGNGTPQQVLTVFNSLHRQGFAVSPEHASCFSKGSESALLFPLVGHYGLMIIVEMFRLADVVQIARARLACATKMENSAQAQQEEQRINRALNEHVLLSGFANGESLNIFSELHRILGEEIPSQMAKFWGVRNGNGSAVLKFKSSHGGQSPYPPLLLAWSVFLVCVEWAVPNEWKKIKPSQRNFSLNFQNEGMIDPRTIMQSVVLSYNAIGSLTRIISDLVPAEVNVSDECHGGDSKYGDADDHAEWHPTLGAMRNIFKELLSATIFAFPKLSSFPKLLEVAVASTYCGERVGLSKQFWKMGRVEVMLPCLAAPDNTDATSLLHHATKRSTLNSDTTTASCSLEPIFNVLLHAKTRFPYQIEPLVGMLTSVVTNESQAFEAISFLKGPSMSTFCWPYPGQEICDDRHANNDHTIYMLKDDLDLSIDLGCAGVILPQGSRGCNNPLEQEIVADNVIRWNIENGYNAWPILLGQLRCGYDGAKEVAAILSAQSQNRTSNATSKFSVSSLGVEPRSYQRSRNINMQRSDRNIIKQWHVTAIRSAGAVLSLMAVIVRKSKKTAKKLLSALGTESDFLGDRRTTQILSAAEIASMLKNLVIQCSALACTDTRLAMRRDAMLGARQGIAGDEVAKQWVLQEEIGRHAHIIVQKCLEVFEGLTYNDTGAVLENVCACKEISTSEASTEEEQKRDVISASMCLIRIRESHLGSYPVSLSLLRLLESLLKHVRAHSVCVDLSSILEHLDTDGDGQVTTDEFRAGMRAWGYGLSSATLDHLVSRFDADGGGYIDYGEFVRFLQESAADAGSVTHGIGRSRGRRRYHAGQQSIFMAASSTGIAGGLDNALDRTAVVERDLAMLFKQVAQRTSARTTLQRIFSRQVLSSTVEIFTGQESWRYSNGNRQQRWWIGRRCIHIFIRMIRDPMQMASDLNGDAPGVGGGDVFGIGNARRDVNSVTVAGEGGGRRAAAAATAMANAAGSAHASGGLVVGVGDGTDSLRDFFIDSFMHDNSLQQALLGAATVLSSSAFPPIPAGQSTIPRQHKILPVRFDEGVLGQCTAFQPSEKRAIEALTEDSLQLVLYLLRFNGGILGSNGGRLKRETPLVTAGFESRKENHLSVKLDLGGSYAQGMMDQVAERAGERWNSAFKVQLLTKPNQRCLAAIASYIDYPRRNLLIPLRAIRILVSAARCMAIVARDVEASERPRLLAQLEPDATAVRTAMISRLYRQSNQEKALSVSIVRLINTAFLCQPGLAGLFLYPDITTVQTTRDTSPIDSAGLGTGAVALPNGRAAKVDIKQKSFVASKKRLREALTASGSVLSAILSIIQKSDELLETCPSLLSSALALCHSIWKGSRGRHHTQLVDAIKAWRCKKDGKEVGFWDCVCAPLFSPVGSLARESKFDLSGDVPNMHRTSSIGYNDDGLGSDEDDDMDDNIIEIKFWTKIAGIDIPRSLEEMKPYEKRLGLKEIGRHCFRLQVRAWSMRLIMLEIFDCERRRVLAKRKEMTRSLHESTITKDASVAKKNEAVGNAAKPATATPAVVKIDVDDGNIEEGMSENLRACLSRLMTQGRYWCWVREFTAFQYDSDAARKLDDLANNAGVELRLLRQQFSHREGERRYGKEYIYNTEALLEAEQMTRADIGGGISPMQELVKALHTTNCRWSLADAQLSLLRAWKNFTETMITSQFLAGGHKRDGDKGENITSATSSPYQSAPLSPGRGALKGAAGSCSDSFALNEAATPASSSKDKGKEKPARGLSILKRMSGTKTCLSESPSLKSVPSLTPLKSSLSLNSTQSSHFAGDGTSFGLLSMVSALLVQRGDEQWVGYARCVAAQELCELLLAMIYHQIFDLKRKYADPRLAVTETRVKKTLNWRQCLRLLDRLKDICATILSPGAGGLTGAGSRSIVGGAMMRDIRDSSTQYMSLLIHTRTLLLTSILVLFRAAAGAKCALNDEKFQQHRLFFLSQLCDVVRQQAVLGLSFGGGEGTYGSTGSKAGKSASVGGAQALAGGFVTTTSGTRDGLDTLFSATMTLFSFLLSVRKNDESFDVDLELLERERVFPSLFRVLRLATTVAAAEGGAIADGIEAGAIRAATALNSNLSHNGASRSSLEAAESIMGCFLCLMKAFTRKMETVGTMISDNGNGSTNIPRELIGMFCSDPLLRALFESRVDGKYENKWDAGQREESNGRKYRIRVNGWGYGIERGERNMAHRYWCKSLLLVSSVLSNARDLNRTSDEREKLVQSGIDFILCYCEEICAALRPNLPFTLATLEEMREASNLLVMIAYHADRLKLALPEGKFASLMESCWRILPRLTELMDPHALWSVRKLIVPVSYLERRQETQQRARRRWTRLKGSLKSGGGFLSLMKQKGLVKGKSSGSSGGVGGLKSILKKKKDTPSSSSKRRNSIVSKYEDKETISDFVIRVENVLLRVMRNVVTFLQIITSNMNDYPTLEFQPAESPVDPPSIGHVTAVLKYCGKMVVHRKPSEYLGTVLQSIAETSLTLILQNIRIHEESFTHTRERKEAIRLKLKGLFETEGILCLAEQNIPSDEKEHWILEGKSGEYSKMIYNILTEMGYGMKPLEKEGKEISMQQWSPMLSNMDHPRSIDLNEKTPKLKTPKQRLLLDTRQISRADRERRSSSYGGLGMRSLASTRSPRSFFNAAVTDTETKKAKKTVRFG
eukprot:g4232.t1